jgi:hypothetical protein
MVRSRSPFRALQVESLEGRDVPTTLQITFDYRFDTLGFFNDPTRRAVLEQAGRDISSRLNATVDLAPISPAGGNTWTATTFDPSNTTQQVQVPNLSLGADQIVVFVGGGAGSSGEAGLGGFGGYSASGNQTWFDTLRSRGRGGFATWGGSVAFEGGANWNFGASPGANQIDFYTVAVHELGHVLGFGIANQWNSLVSGNQFTGASARAANGGTNPLVSVSNPGHWAQGITSNGAAVSMQPYVQAGTRVGFSTLDFASLADLGWEVSAISSATSPVPGASVTTPAPATSPVLSSISPVVVGGDGGTYQVYSAAGGGFTPVGGAVSPFPGYTGPIRTTTGDFDGDGVKDIAAAAGPNTTPLVKVFSGRTGQEVRTFYAYEEAFRGGTFLAAGDFDGDGRDDLVVGADEGGGPRVRVFRSADPSQVVADFWGIEDMNFRGGVRVAAGDLNGDGRDDLVVSAGPGGGPRVSLYDGRGVAVNQPAKFMGDFFAYSPTVNDGAYVAVGDYNGDGFADVAFGPGSASAHLKVYNGRTLITQGAGVAESAPLVNTMLPSTPGYIGGLRVAAEDYDGDGRVDLLAGTGRNSEARLHLLDGVGQLDTYSLFGGVSMPSGLQLS